MDEPPVRMTAPAVAACRFGWACLIGAGLGGVYGFFRPLRLRRTAAADTLFLLVTVWAWTYLSFGICGGDLRLAYHAGMLLGGILFDRTLGRLLQPIFGWFWRCVGSLCAAIMLPAKIFLNFLKILFAFLFVFS